MRGCDGEQLHRLRRAAAIINAAHLAVRQTRGSRVIFANDYAINRESETDEDFGSARSAISDLHRLLSGE